MIDPSSALRELLDLEELRRLKARYFRAVDTIQWDDFGSVFTVDAVLQMPEVDLEVRGRDAIVDAVRTSLGDVHTVHHGHMPELDITGPDTATGIWAMFDYLLWPRAESGERRTLQGYGHYFEQYQRVEGRWHIASTRVERLRVDLTPGIDG